MTLARADERMYQREFIEARMTDATHQELQALYRDSSAGVRPRFQNSAEALQHYAAYVDFVKRSAPSGGRLLDAGCGDGWTSELFRAEAFDVVGIDLQVSFSPKPATNLRFEQASVQELPFPNESFDVVTSHQMLEHVPDPERAVREMVRVLRPRGIVCVVGPNLLSPLSSLRSLTRYVWRNRPLATIFVRAPNMPRHPGGNTIPEVLSSFARNTGHIAKKLASSEVDLTWREPDLVPPFHSDNDSTWLANPIDIAKLLRKLGCTIRQRGAYGRPRGTWLLASGTWIAAEKP